MQAFREVQRVRPWMSLALLLDADEAGNSQNAADAGSLADLTLVRTDIATYAAQKTARPAGANYPVECYFERAMQFRPADRAVRVIYASYLGKTGKKTEAINQLLRVQEMDGPKNPYVPYEIGLLYFDLGDFEKSLAFAHRANREGATLEGLKNRLLKAGKWRDPPADAAPAARRRSAAQAK